MVILHFLVVAAAFAVIDAVWLKTMNPFYRNRIGDLLADKPHLGYAVAFYVMYIAGIVFFALRPALDGGTGSPPSAMGRRWAPLPTRRMTSRMPPPSRRGRCSLLSWTSSGGAALTGLSTLAGWLVFRSP
jgi:predicted outer membrane lipoprotein